VLYSDINYSFVCLINLMFDYLHSNQTCKVHALLTSMNRPPIEFNIDFIVDGKLAFPIHSDGILLCLRAKKNLTTSASKLFVCAVNNSQCEGGRQDTGARKTEFLVIL